jgi:hypothetical protein
MNTDEIDGNWEQQLIVEEKPDQLVGKIQERYGITREEAQRQIAEFDRNGGGRAPWSQG